MVECGGHIKECGVREDIKIIRSPVSTEYVTQNFTTTTETTLPTQTVVIKSVKVVTVNNQTQGHCRQTMTVSDLKPAIITVNVTVEHVREIVPITTIVSVETSIYTVTSIEQCFINNPEPSFFAVAPSAQDPSSAAVPSQDPSSAIVSSHNPFSSEEPQAHVNAILDDQGETGDIRRERIYQNVDDDMSENPGLNIQGD
ncbi:hypothetical protein NW768_000984 [Fusarium equiseti]|uniref:Uncharacterized protein n=1 Tax=Fusarium equiseti TaxID=61235 RepID=A0ABQ8RUS0_FUSEQ|nr:hypothetical protein NW768_000984 [Fusarium equiseti]